MKLTQKDKSLDKETFEITRYVYLLYLGLNVSEDLVRSVTLESVLCLTFGFFSSIHFSWQDCGFLQT